MKQLSTPIITTILLVASFFCGVYFAQTQNVYEREARPIPRVYLEQLKTKLNIRREGDVEVYLNGQKMTDDIKVNLTR